MSNENIELFDFEKLNVYQKSLDLIDFVYDITEDYPPKELYNITAQFKRAVNSVSLNIGEGSAGSRREFIQFLIIAKRSLRECVVCTTISYRRKYINSEVHFNLRKKLTEISKMLSGLERYLESDKAKDTLSEPAEDYLTSAHPELFAKDRLETNLENESSKDTLSGSGGDSQRTTNNEPPTTNG